MWNDGHVAGPASPAKVVFPAIRRAGADTGSEGYTHGHAAGYSAGLRAAAAEQRGALERQQAQVAATAQAHEQQLSAAAAAFQRATSALHQLNAGTILDAERALLETSLELAEAILGYELTDGERSARAALERALTGTDPRDVARIRLHPDDAKVVARHPETAAAGVDILPDPSLHRGDAIAEYQNGWLDARLASALERAKTALLAEGP